MHKHLMMRVTIAGGCALALLRFGACGIASEFTAGAANSATQPFPIRAPESSFRDCPGCPEMVWIPGGRFVMGVAPGEEEREQLGEPFRHRSQPQREVTVRSFATGKYEITRGQYRVFAEATNRGGDGCFVWTGNDFAIDNTKSWRNTGFSQDDAHPAVCVSWEDANAYARWLSQTTGKNYRLLSEAEWEYAARAGAMTARYWGNDADQSCEYANGADRTAQAQIPDAIAFICRQLPRPPCFHRPCRQLSRQRVWPARHAGQRGRVDAGLLERRLQRRAHRWQCVGQRRMFHARRARRLMG